MRNLTKEELHQIIRDLNKRMTSPAELRKQIEEDAKMESHLDWVKEQTEEEVPQGLKDAYEAERWADNL